MYEFVEGGTLGNAIAEWRDLPFPERLDSAVRLLHTIAGALAIFHRFDPPLVHRDLKPQNVMMARGTPRITDFGIGSVVMPATTHVSFEAARALAPEAPLRCADPAIEKQMISAIDAAKEAGDTLGGSFEVVVRNLPIGLGSYVQWDRKLDGRLAQALMSIPAIKAVSIGDGVEGARRPGSQVHDEIVARIGAGPDDPIIARPGAWQARAPGFPWFSGRQAGGSASGIAPQPAHRRRRPKAPIPGSTACAPSVPPAGRRLGRLRLASCGFAADSDCAGDRRVPQASATCAAPGNWPAAGSTAALAPV